MTRRRRARGPVVLAACVAALILAAPAGAAPGDLDGGFGSGGLFTASFLTTDPGRGDSQKVAIDSQGRVVVAATREGQYGGGLPRAIKVFRLTPQGQPDPTFAGGTEVTLPVTGDAFLGGLVIDAQDRPVIAGVSEELPNSQIALVRVTTTGQPDASFSGDGQLVTGLPASPFLAPQVSGLAIDAEGGLLVAGIAYSSGGAGGYTRTFYVSRFTAGGDQDVAYGVGGWRQIGVPGPGARELTAIAALPSGGAFVSGFDDNWFVTRLTGAGAFDSQFDGDGTAISVLGKGALDTVSNYGLTIDSQGRPIVVGEFVSGNARWAIARWTTAGALDATFGTGTPAPGVVLGPATYTVLEDVDLQCDGKLVVTGIGSRADLTDNAIAVARYTATGALDTTFAPGASTPGIALVEPGTRAGGFDLALSAGAATVAGFRKAVDLPLGLREQPVLARLLKDDSCAGAPQTPTPKAIPPAPAPATPAAAALPAFAGLVTLPGTKRCVSRRRFSIRLRVPRGSAVTSAEVRVNGKRVAVRTGARLRSVVNLTKLPKGRFRVDITMKLADGRAVKGTRSYRTCAVKRRPGRGPRV